MKNLEGVSVNGESLDKFFEKQKSNEINTLRKNDIKSKSFRYYSPSNKNIKTKGEKNGDVEIWSRNKIYKEITMKEILTKEMSTKDKMVAILLSGDDITSKTALLELEKAGFTMRANAVSASLINLHKTDLGKVIYKDGKKRPFVFTMHPLAAEHLDFLTALRIAQKSDSFSIKNLMGNEHIKKAVDDVKAYNKNSKYGKAEPIERETDTTEHETVKTDTTHTYTPPDAEVKDPSIKFDIPENKLKVELTVKVLFGFLKG